MKIKTLIVFIALMSSYLFVSVSLFDTVNATSSYVDIDFEGTVLGSWYYDSYIRTNRTSGATNTDVTITSTCANGTRGLRYYGSGGSTSTYKVTGFMNLTYDITKFLTNITFWFYHSGDNNPSNDMYIVFYNHTNMYTWWDNDKINRGIVNIHIERDTGNLIANTVTLSGAYAKWNKFSMGFTNDLGDMEIKFNSSYSALLDCNNATGISVGWRIDRIYICSYSQVTVNYIVFDDLRLTYSDTYSGTGVSGCDVDLTGYNKVGIDNTPYTMDLSYYQFQKVHYVLSYGYLKAISLCVSPTMYSIDSTSSNYNAVCLGFDLGGADCFYIDGYNYRLIWECNIDLGERIEGISSGRYIDVLFSHSSPLFGSTYWQVCIGSAGSDLDSDGSTFFKLWNSGRTRIERDVGVSFYFDPTTQYQPPDSAFSDSLGLHNYYDDNETGFFFDINQPEGIVCSYLLSQESSAYSCKINVLKNGSYYYNKTGLTFPSGVIGVLPDTIGRYDFKLYNYHYIYNITAYVTGSASPYFISTIPTITNPYETYQIYYRYYNPTGTKGCIGIFTNLSRRNSFVYANHTFAVDNNGTDYITYPSISLRNEYFTLFSNVSYKQAVAFSTHYIRDTNIMENNIYVSPDTVSFGGSSMILGTHLYPACDISIFIDGLEFSSVKGEQTFNRSYYPTYEGLLNISLRIKQNDSWVTLKYCYLSVTASESEGEEEVSPVMLIPPPFSYIMGAFITVIFLVLPAIGVGKLHINSDIMKYVPVVSGSVGFILSCLLGFFPWYSIFAFVLVIVILIAIVYQSKKVAT